MVDQQFWKDKRVFVTGHTGFKGSWLCLWLHSLGANVTGYALDPPTEPSLYTLCKIDSLITSVIGDIRDKARLRNALFAANPEIVIHMAAQPIVRESYRVPVETYETNVLGTVYLLDAVRQATENGQQIRAVVNVTTDKCYENNEWHWGYREDDRLGGADPYSNSKACSELVTTAFVKSFFHSKTEPMRRIGIATARAGNVIGGGDWAVDRLIPDCVRSIASKNTITIRNHQAVRPWQHVLEPVSGYLLLAEKLYSDSSIYSGAWNFGPDDRDIRSVEWIVNQFCLRWGDGLTYQIQPETKLKEANTLRLDCSKAKAILGWVPKWNIEIAIDKILVWTKGYQEGADLRTICLQQINEYTNWVNR